MCCLSYYSHPHGYYGNHGVVALCSIFTHTFDRMTQWPRWWYSKITITHFSLTHSPSIHENCAMCIRYITGLHTSHTKSSLTYLCYSTLRRAKKKKPLSQQPPAAAASSSSQQRAIKEGVEGGAREPSVANTGTRIYILAPNTQHILLHKCTNTIHPHYNMFICWRHQSHFTLLTSFGLAVCVWQNIFHPHPAWFRRFSARSPSSSSPVVVIDKCTT